MRRVYWRGKLRPWREVVFSPINSGLLFGENIFEAVPVFKGRPLFLHEHLNRLKKGCRLLGWPLLPEKEFIKAIRLFANDSRSGNEFIIRFNLVQELDGQVDPRIFLREPPTLFATVRSFRSDYNSLLPIRAKIGISPWRAADDKTVPNSFKISFYLTTRIVFRNNPGWGEMLRLNRVGQIVDGGLSTPMLFNGKNVLVPPLNLGGLESVTRIKVIGLLKRLSIPVLEKPWRIENIYEKGELFFVGSGIGVMSPTHLESRRINFTNSLAIELWQCYRKWADQKAVI